MTENYFFKRLITTLHVCMYTKETWRINSIKCKNWRHFGGLCWFFKIGFLFMHIIKSRPLIYLALFLLSCSDLENLVNKSQKKNHEKYSFFKSMPQCRWKIPHRIQKSSVYLYKHVCAYTYMYIQLVVYWNDKFRKSQDCAGGDPNSLIRLCNLHTKTCCSWPMENICFVRILLKIQESLAGHLVPVYHAACQSQTSIQMLRIRIKGKTLKANLWEMSLLRSQ